MNNSTDNLRFILLASLGFVLLMLWQAWQQDYKTDTKLTPPSATDQAEDSDDVPVVPVNTKQPGRVAENSSLPATRQVKVETDLYQVSIDLKGGGLNKLGLLNYPISIDQPNWPVVLLDETPKNFYLVQGGLLSDDGGPDHRNDFTAIKDYYLLEDTQSRLVVPLFWEADNGLRVTKTYHFTRDSYLIDIRYQIENGTEDDWTGYAYSQLQRNDPGRTSNLLYTYNGAVISSPQKRYTKISFSDMEEGPLDESIVDGWAAMLQHYFVSALIPVDPGESHHYYTLVPEDNRYIIGATTRANTIAAGTVGHIEQRLYIGPKVQSRLKEVADGLELTVDYGILWFLAKPLFWCLEKFYTLTGNWGWAIILITLMLKLVFYKLSAAGYKSMAKMRSLHPRLMALRERYKDDRMKLNQAMMNIYKQEKVNPLGGCLPVLVQIPVFIALYWTLLESVELRQSAFIFWLTDLSAADPLYVLPVLMGITMILQQKLNPMPMDPIQQKIITILPIVFTLFFAFFPSGLVLYWLVNNILSIVQQWIITRKIERLTPSSP